MTNDGYLVERVREGLSEVAASLSEKRMFGGTTFLLNGNMLCCVSRTGLMVRVGAQGEAQALESSFAKPCPGAGRRMAGFIIVDYDGLGSKESVTSWLGRARRYVETLPPKALKPAKASGTRKKIRGST